MTFVKNVKDVFDTIECGDTRDSGQQLISTVIMISGFAIMALLAANWIDTAILNKAADVSACVEGVNVSSTAASTTSKNTCAAGDTTLKSYTADAGYIGRMP